MCDGCALFSVHVPTPGEYYLEIFANKVFSEYSLILATREYGAVTRSVASVYMCRLYCKLHFWYAGTARLQNM